MIPSTTQPPSIQRISFVCETLRKKYMHLGILLSLDKSSKSIYTCMFHDNNIKDYVAHTWQEFRLLPNPYESLPMKFPTQTPSITKYPSSFRQNKALSNLILFCTYWTYPIELRLQMHRLLHSQQIDQLPFAPPVIPNSLMQIPMLPRLFLFVPPRMHPVPSRSISVRRINVWHESVSIRRGFTVVQHEILSESF